MGSALACCAEPHYHNGVILQPLKPFQDTPNTQGYTVFAGVSWQQGILRFSYEVRGHLDLILWPALASGADRKDFLWQTTCLEAFIAQPNSPAYLEFNLSPSGQSAVYAFDAYRARNLDPALNELKLAQFECTQSSDHFQLQATLDPREYPFANMQNATELVFGLTAVVEHRDQSKAYFALEHLRSSDPQKDRPDFHQAKTFTWQLRKV